MVTLQLDAMYFEGRVGYGANIGGMYLFTWQPFELAYIGMHFGLLLRDATHLREETFRIEQHTYRITSCAHKKWSLSMNTLRWRMRAYSWFVVGLKPWSTV